MPTAGTAYASLADLRAHRDTDGVALQPGEILAAGGQHARVIDGPDGPQLATDAPAPRPDLGL
jgi:hypothetical protein